MIRDTTLFLAGALVALSACAIDNEDGEVEATEAYVVFDDLENVDAVAELRASADDALLGVLRWDNELDLGVLSIAADESELSVQGVARDDQTAIEQALIAMYGAALASDQEPAPGDVDPVSLATDPRGVLERVVRTDGRRGGDSCAHRNVTYRASGWAFDNDQSPFSIWVHFYAVRGRTSKYIGAAYANRPSQDVNRAFGISGRHRWVFTLPEAWDGDKGGAKDLRLRAYGINLPKGQGQNHVLNGFPRYGAHDQSRPGEPGIFRCYP